MRVQCPRCFSYTGACWNGKCTCSTCGHEFKRPKEKKNQIHSGRQVFNMAQEFLFKGL